MTVREALARLPIPWLDRSTRVSVYRAIVPIETVDGTTPNVVMWATGRGLDEPLLLRNEVPFEMPDDPSFVVTHEGSFDAGPETLPLYYVQAVDSGAFDAGRMDRVVIPDGLTGRPIPRIEDSTDELRARL